MKRIYIVILVAVFGTHFAQAQTDPLYAQYMMNPVLINPGYTGLSNNLNASASYRKQWAGFDGSPVTINATVHTSLRDNKMGLGLIILKDEIGPNKNAEVHATYAYKLDLGGKYLSLGLQGGVVNFRSDNGDLNIYHPEDPAFLGTINTTKPSFGAGAVFHSDRYFVGISVPRMLKATATYENMETELYSQHYYLTAAYVIYLNERIRFKPSALLRGVKGVKPSADLNMVFNFDEKYSAGAFTRNFNTYGVMAQLKLNSNYRFGYTLEVPMNNSVGTRFTSHEVMLGINMSLFDFHDKFNNSVF